MPLDAEARHDLDAMQAEITVATRLVLICNPNNPTSTAVDLKAIEEFLERVPRHICVILDEAYCEFSLRIGDPYASLDLLRRHATVPLLRTFSKVYGLAGLRAGYALCGSSELRAAVDQLRQPFYLNAVAQAAAVEALAPPGRGRAAGQPRRWRCARRSRTASVELGLWVAESDANFIWMYLPEEHDVAVGLVTASARARRAGPRRRVAGPARRPAGHGRERAREPPVHLAALGQLVG